MFPTAQLMHRRLGQLGLASILLASLPAAALACSCSMPFSQGEPVPVRTSPVRRSVVFVGNVIAITAPIDEQRSYIVRFVTELSWRGAMPDTVSLRVAASPCAYFSVGLRYVVGAEPDERRRGRLRTEGCDEALRVGDLRGNAVLDTLGAPTWRAPPLGEREIGQRALPLGTPLARSPFPGGVYFTTMLSDSVESVSIGDLRLLRRDGTEGIPFGAFLESGKAYRYRVTWDNGSAYESVLISRCGAFGGPPESCALTVPFSLLAPAP